jgi:hypothetical protein
MRHTRKIKSRYTAALNTYTYEKGITVNSGQSSCQRAVFQAHQIYTGCSKAPYQWDWS